MTASATTGTFGRHVLTLATGTVVAQAIPFAVSPILTRLFSPRDFATLAVFLGIAGPLGIVATGRYELAIVLPASDQEARNVRRLVVTLGTVVSLLALFVVVALYFSFVRVGRNRWLFALPAAMLAGAAYQAYAYWANRKRAYRALALANIMQQLLVAGFCVVGGMVMHGGGASLVVGTVAAQLCGAVFLYFLARDSVRSAAPVKLRQAATEHWRFPTYNLPYSFIGTFSAGALPVLMAAMGHVPTAGLFAQARRILYAPASLLSVSIGQVYFQEAARSIGQPRLEELTIQLLRGLAWLGTPLYVLGSCWAPEAFALLFGAPWREAGVIAQWFGPVAFCYLFTSWPERIYEITKNQRLAFMLQVAADGVSLGTFTLLLAIGTSPLTAIAAYTILYCSYHFAYLYILGRIAHFRVARLWLVLRDILVIGTLTQASIMLVALVGVPSVVKFTLELSAIILFLFVSRNRWRGLSRRAGATSGGA